MVTSRLLNSPEGDPAVLLELPNQGHSYLLDCGSLANLSLRDLLRIRKVFISHAHIDHFFGFDHLVRMQLFVPDTLDVYGPPGMLGYVRGKLSGYAWNLVSDSRYAIRVHELHDDRVVSQLLPCHRSFAPEAPVISLPPLQLAEGPELTWARLDHGVDCLAYCLRWPTRRKVDRQALAELGVPPGAWIEQLKAGSLSSLMVGEEPWSAERLRARLLRDEPGYGLAYATDSLMSKPVMKRLIALAQGVDELWCEAAYLHKDLEKAREHRHMTARQAARLAVEAGARKLYLFHMSRRYAHHAAHIKEARAVFAGAAPPPQYQLGDSPSRSSAGSPS